MRELTVTQSNVCFLCFISKAVKPGGNPLLFPCGNLRRETIPTEMAKAGNNYLLRKAVVWLEAVMAWHQLIGATTGY